MNWEEGLCMFADCWMTLMISFFHEETSNCQKKKEFFTFLEIKNFRISGVFQYWVMAIDSLSLKKGCPIFDFYELSILGN